MKRYLIAMIPVAALAVTFEEFAAQHPDKDIHRAAAAYEASRAPTPQVVDEAALDAAWLESTERASRVAAANIVTSIKSTLAQIGVTPRERAQVIGDVTAWVSGGPGQKADRLEVSLRLMLAYERLAELVGDTTGLIAGTRAVSLDRTKPTVIAVTP